MRLTQEEVGQITGLTTRQIINLCDNTSIRKNRPGSGVMSNWTMHDLLVVKTYSYLHKMGLEATRIIGAIDPFVDRAGGYLVVAGRNVSWETSAEAAIFKHNEYGIGAIIKLSDVAYAVSSGIAQIEKDLAEEE